MGASPFRQPPGGACCCERRWPASARLRRPLGEPAPHGAGGRQVPVHACGNASRRSSTNRPIPALARGPARPPKHTANRARRHGPRRRHRAATRSAKPSRAAPTRPVVDCRTRWPRAPVGALQYLPGRDRRWQLRANACSDRSDAGSIRPSFKSAVPRKACGQGRNALLGCRACPLQRPGKRAASSSQSASQPASEHQRSADHRFGLDGLLDIPGLPRPDLVLPQWRERFVATRNVARDEPFKGRNACLRLRWLDRPCS